MNIQSFLKIVVAALICYVIYLIFAMLISGTILTITAIVLTLVWILFIVKEIGI